MKPVLFILAVFCFTFCNTPVEKGDPSYTSFKKLESGLKAQGIEFSEPQDDQGRMRIVAKNRPLGIYFDKDTVTEVKMNVVIKSDRTDIKKHFPIFIPIISLVDPTAASWMEQELAANTDYGVLEKTNIINDRYYLMNYYPDMDRDLLNIGVFYREPSFFRR